MNQTTKFGLKNHTFKKSVPIHKNVIYRWHFRLFSKGKIVNENGEIIPLGEDGELCVRGYCVMLGYWDDEDKTKSTIDASGWFHTG